MSDFEKLINPFDYTTEIKGCISILKNRMRNMLVDYKEDDIKSFLLPDGAIYILCNPILGTEYIYNNDGTREQVPMKNITIFYKEFEFTRISNEFRISIPRPHLRILNPYLLMKIMPNGTIIDGEFPPTAL